MTTSQFTWITTAQQAGWRFTQFKGPIPWGYPPPTSPNSLVEVPLPALDTLPPAVAPLTSPVCVEAPVGVFVAVGPDQLPPPKAP